MQNLDRLSPQSRALAQRLLDAQGQFEQFVAAAVERALGEGEELVVRLPSPTGEANRDLVVWIDLEGEASLSFGEWHTHDAVLLYEPTIQSTNVVELAVAITFEQVVLAFDIDGEFEGGCGPLDLRFQNAIQREISKPHSPTTMRIASWGGTVDQVVRAPA